MISVNNRNDYAVIVHTTEDTFHIMGKSSRQLAGDIIGGVPSGVIVTALDLDKVVPVSGKSKKVEDK